MITRHQASGFAAGALAFPGGKVEPGDAALRSCCPGTDALDDRALALRVAAVREAFEEAGLLLARAGRQELTGAQVVDLRRRRAGQLFAELVRGAKLALEIAGLVRFAHWITPPDRPKRFDTHFFVAPAPAYQSAFHDGREAVGHLWIRPAAALAEAAAGRRILNIATYMILTKLGRHLTVAAALEAAERETVVPIIVETVDTADGPMLRLPPDCGYDETLIPAAKVHRA